MSFLDFPLNLPGLTVCELISDGSIIEGGESSTEFVPFIAAGAAGDTAVASNVLLVTDSALDGTQLRT